MTETILAVGATGKFAGLVIPALVKRDARVRGLIRKLDDEKKVKDLGAAEIAVGDLQDTASLNAALKGVNSMFYIAPAFLPNEAEIGKSVVEAAVRAGVRRIVFSSVIHPVLSELSNHAAKAPVEAAILNSGLEYSFLHPSLYFQNYAAAWAKVVETGELAEPWSNDTKFSRVDYRDVAEVAAIALTEDRLLYGTFELCSTDRLNRTEVAAMISEILGKTITARRIDPASLGDEAKPMLPMFQHYDHDGLLGNSLTLQAILGYEPRTLHAYFEELASELKPDK